MKSLLKIFICFLAASLCIYVYMNKLNKMTEIRLKIPPLKRELKEIKEENMRLQYEIERFESPLHLMELSRKNEFSHLKYPYANEVILIEDDEN